MRTSSQKPAPTLVLSPGEELAPLRALEPGTLVSNRYRVVGLLGQGAMGAVYRVEHVHMRKPFALKVLHDGVSGSPEIVARFEREAVAAGNIGHVNVAAATDFGKLSDGSFCLVRELVCGRRLRAELEGGRLEARRALRIMQGIIAGVAAAHRKGIVHRDLKPENIMLVERDGNPDFVKVLDFGIAKVDALGSAARESGAQPLTQVGTVMGTPVYMSPEQAVAQTVDARSDLYTLGIILFELLTGECPFRGSMISVLRRHLMAEPPPLPPGILEQWDPMMARVVRKLLERDPEKRFQTAAELAIELDAVAVTLEGKGAPSRRATTTGARVAASRSVSLAKLIVPVALRLREDLELFVHQRVMPRLQRYLPASTARHVTVRRTAATLCLLFASLIAVSALAFCASKTEGRTAPFSGPPTSDARLVPGGSHAEGAQPGHAREPSRSPTRAPK